MKLITTPSYRKSIGFYLLFLLWFLFYVVGRTFYVRAYIPFMGICLMLTAWWAPQIYKYFFKANKELKISSITFFGIALVTLVLSWFYFVDTWRIIDLPYEQKFVIRHFSVVLQYGITFAFAYIVFKEVDYLKFPVGVVAVIVLAYLFLNRGGQMGRPLAVMGISYYAAKSSKMRFLILLTPLLLYNTEGSSHVLSIAVIIGLYLFRGPLVSLLRHNIGYGKVLLAVAAIVIVVFSTNALAGYLSDDPNAFWRYTLWKDEIDSLSQTYYTGVGFGTAYVKTTFLDQVYNFHMYYDERGIFDPETLFLVANHNSLMNMFYRMGIPGGVAYICLCLSIIRWALALYKKTPIQTHKNLLFWGLANYFFNFVVIFLNPGMESPQFAMGFFMAQGLVLGICGRAQYILNLLRKGRIIKQRRTNPTTTTAVKFTR